MRLLDIPFTASPNFSRGRAGSTIDFIVIHITDGQPDFHRCLERFCRKTTEASPHFLVGREGQIVQLVDTDDRAWHARGWNTESVGIEHVARTPGELGPDDAGLPLTEVQLRASAELVARLCWLLQLKPSRATIRPHRECPQTTHDDCGRDIADGGIWPWTDYMALVLKEYAALSVTAAGAVTAETTPAGAETTPTGGTNQLG